ncbi:NAD-dependent epimerase/dehydratase family protein [Nocardiopsis sp. LOL_012]|uniref:NAD-dependent epimerase/dehydratase family protein n=1 Tax=Nocardiopsis sp. LOL_012 TaxID=3345409 RepID=UPI003A855B55
MTTHDRILVTGGTGMTGRRVTDLLRQRGADVIVGSRKGEPPFEWHDPATWDAVLEGTTAVYLCYHPDIAFPGAAEALGSLAERAAGAGVERAVLLSGRGMEEALVSERAVREHLPRATVVRCAMFAQNYSESFFLDQVRGGTVVLPVADVPEPFVDLDDVAEATVAALTADGHAGQDYELTGPRSLTFTEAAAVLSGASGRPVAHATVDPEAFAAGALAEGHPAEIAHGMVELFGQILDGRNREPGDGVRRVLGRPARDFTEYARRAAEAGAWG